MIGQSGIRDWKLQRLTAVYLALYTFFFIFYFFQHSPMDYDTWVMLFANPWMQVASLFSLLCIVMHAWLGLWTILTDYIKSISIRYLLQTLILLALFGYFVWGTIILWGI